jgi:hypothetical protein
MPQEWVDDELKGAEALAYRLDLDVYGTNKPHPAPTYIAGRVWCRDKDKQVYH